MEELYLEILEFVYIVSFFVEVRSCVEVVIDCVRGVVKKFWLNVDVEVCVCWFEGNFMLVYIWLIG